MEKENRTEEIIAKIDASLESVKEKDIRFFRVDEFKRNIRRVHEFSFRLRYTVPRLMPGNSRREYDRLIHRLSRHMRKEHGFYTPYWFSYLYAFYGFISGFLLGFLLSVFFTDKKDIMYGIGFSLCIVAAYIIGSRKDLKIRMANKLM